MNKSIEIEYGKWLRQINVKGLNKFDITLINIITENLDAISRVGTHQGKRAKLLGELIEKRGSSLESELKILQSDDYGETDIIKNLRTLEVESFRGFTNSRLFDFDKQYMFMYGPNGSGKSSLSEALEYSLTGTIAEADSRNIKIEKYIKNTETKKSKLPVLSCEYEDGSINTAKSNYEEYRFSIIEKNRIDDFSRIEAATSKSQSERISALFGISDFVAFVREFTDSFDGRYINLKKSLAESYKEKEDKYKTAKELITTEREKKAELAASSLKIIAEINDASVTDLDGVIEYISNPQTGKLNEINELWSKTNHMSSDAGKLEEIKGVVKNITEHYSIIKRERENLADNVMDLKLEALYRAVDDVDNEGFCPVCGTSLDNTARNPFEFVKTELSRLDHIKQSKNAINYSAGEIVKLTKDYILFYNSDPWFRDSLSIDSEPVEIIDKSEYEKETSAFLSNKEYFDSVLKLLNDECAVKMRLESYDERINASIMVHNEEIKKWQELQRKATEQNTLVKENDEKLRNIVQLIHSFEAGHEDLLKQIKDEDDVVTHNEKMVEAYTKICRRMAMYVNKLPSILGQGLSEKIAEYYNIINYDDAEFEKIEKIDLPEKSSDKIKVTFKDGVQSDALQILSEGHIKILGLSILLAKFTNKRGNFLVFDDIVNAIDDDHRDGVAELLIRHEDFVNKQIILSCHGDQFITKLEDKLGSKNSKKINRYMFIPADCLEERGILVEYTDAKYPLTVASEKYAANNLKDAASKARQAAECIVNNLWKKLSSVGGMISVGMRRPNTQPDLSSVVDALINKLKQYPGAECLKDSLIELKEQSNWKVLNKGTHFENEQKEFERADIKRIISLLEGIDDEVRKLKLVPSVKS